MDATAPPDVRKSVILVSERFGYIGGGEAIKAQQYANFLLEAGYDLKIVTAERSKTELGAVAPDGTLFLIPDTFLQKVLWRVPFLRYLLGTHFQIHARRMIARIADGPSSAILHYISPVSPVAPRFPPAGYHTVMGPLTGNISYPKGFRNRMSLASRARSALHEVAQVVIGALVRDKRNADALLVSGYERTRESLRLAGCRDAAMVDVVDSGVSDGLLSRPRIAHAGVDRRFCCAARFIDYKGIDLAIRAVAAAHPDTTLSVYGDGDLRADLERQVASLGLGDRVTFHGWVHNDVLTERFGAYRGYVMPSLAEANGIVMQEAMMVGLPVVAFRWGGPGMLADDASAIYVEPRGEAEAVRDIAAAMDRLGADGAYADAVSRAAHAMARERFTWAAVATSWLSSYASAGMRTSDPAVPRPGHPARAPMA